MFNSKIVCIGIISCLSLVKTMNSKEYIEVVNADSIYPYSLMVRYKKNDTPSFKCLVLANRKKIIKDKINECLKNRSQDWDAEVTLFKNTSTGMRYMQSTAIKSDEIDSLLYGVPFKRSLKVTEIID